MFYTITTPAVLFFFLINKNKILNLHKIIKKYELINRHANPLVQVNGIPKMNL